MIKTAFGVLININDAIPPYEVEVLTTNGKYWTVAARMKTTKDGEHFEKCGYENERRSEVPVTHWMSLPPLPEKK